MYAEVLEILEPLLKRRVPVAQRAALYGVEHLGRVERKHRRIAEIGRAYAVFLHAECVRRVIYDLEAVFFGDLFYRLDIAEIAVDMHRHDRAGPVRDKALYLPGVNGIVLRVYIAEHRRAAAADYGVRCRCESERRGDDLALQLQRLDDILKREVAVGKKRDVRYIQILFQLGLQLLMLHAHICQPAAVPYVSYLLAVLLKAGH